MNIVVTCDSAADLTPELIEENDIKIIPFTINMGNKEYKDGVDLTSKMLLEYCAANKELPKTSAVNEYAFDEFFTKHNTKDALIYFSLSSKISGTHDFAVTAAKKHKNVYVIDSLSLSSGISIQMLYAIDLIKQGLSVEEVVEKVKARRKNVQTSFQTYSLENLHKGGRCSSLQLLGANLLKIRPSIALVNGKMEMNKKYMGTMEKCLKKYFEDTFAEYNKPVLNRAFLTYSSATPELLKVCKEAISKKVQFENLYENTASATITTHCGQNTIGIIYYND